MRILWVCNIPIPMISIAMGRKPENVGGWLTGFANSLLKEKDVHLYISFPVIGEKAIVKGSVNNITYYGFPLGKRFGILPISDETKLSPKLAEGIREIITEVQPDILHIFGTEFMHALLATKVFNMPSKTVVNIQGLTSICAKHYCANLPINILNKFVVSNLIRGSILEQRNRLVKRGNFERELLQNVDHIIGRTDWDRACTMQINPVAEYHFCNESLRDEFYKYRWDISGCDRYSIFMSQATTPLKGLHYMLEAMPEIIRRFPQAHLYVSGNNPTNTEGLYNALKISSYGNYIKKMIKKYGLQEHITFTGNLNEVKMCERFLDSHVFVSASTVENESNSLSEAKILGVPAVVSFVGGVTSRIKHDDDGFSYQHDAPYMLAYYVCKIFSDDNLAIKFSRKSRQYAQKTHDRGKNTSTLLTIYQQIAK